MIKVEKFLKRPIEIEAVLCDYPNDPAEVAVWCGGKVCGVGHVGEKVWIEIETSEGTMKANYGDWIIKEPFPTSDRKFYPCKPDIFRKTYTPAIFNLETEN